MRGDAVASTDTHVGLVAPITGQPYPREAEITDEEGKRVRSAREERWAAVEEILHRPVEPGADEELKRLKRKAMFSPDGVAHEPYVRKEDEIMPEVKASIEEALRNADKKDKGV